MQSAIFLLFSVLSCAVHYANGKLVFCYFSSFAQTRTGIGKFLPEDIDPFLCSHVIFAFVDITKDGKELRAFNWNDAGPNGLYKRTIALKEKNPALKVLLAVGGWQIGSKPFIPMISSEQTRVAWIKNVVTYIREHNFDGFDMDWEFPGTRGSAPEDKYRFTMLMKELYEAFEEEAAETGNERLLLTLATASGTYYINQSYEPSEIIKYVDYMLLMTYNYHGHWEKSTGHHSGLWKHRNDSPGEKSELHTQWSIDFWLNIGIPKSKLIVGIPTYGMSYTLEDPDDNGIQAPASGGGKMGEYTSETGILSYYEICDQIMNNGWEEEWIEDQEVPYAHGGNQWVGFENQESIRLKAENILERGLAGAFVWSVEMDDFSGHCGEGKYPLLNVIKKYLKPSEGGPRFRQRDWLTEAPRMKTTDWQDWSKDWENENSEWEESHTRRPIGRSRPTWRPMPKWRPTWKAETRDKIWTASPRGSRNPFLKPKSKTRTEKPSLAGLIDCSKLGLGIYYDPISCDHFFLCIPGGWGAYRPMRMDCPAGTRFDKDLKICNHANSIECWD